LIAQGLLYVVTFEREEFRMGRKWVVFCLISWAAASCAHLPQTARSPHVGVEGPIGGCADFFEALDQEVTQAGGRDPGAFRVAGYPYLRVDRFLASFRESVTTQEAFEAWLDRMQDLDREGRHFEIANLPAERHKSLPKSFPTGDLEARVSTCGDILRSADFVDSAERQRLREAATPFDDYISLRRVLGLYPISSYFISLGVEKYQASARAIYSSQPPADKSEMRRYGPGILTEKMTDSAEIVARAPRDGLSIPHYSPAEMRALFSAHAPIWEVQTHGDHDRIGLPCWNTALAVDTSHPVTYEHLSFTRFENQVLTQLNYVIWFPSRPSTGPFDILAGFLDGLNYRVTLDIDGYPLLYETMHNCGCYHKYYPSARLRPRAETGYREPPLILTAPAMPENARMVVSMESGTHYVRHLYPDDGAGSATTVTYQRSDYDDLRSLPSPEGSRRSLFKEDSLVPESYRKERWILWPTGVLSPGAMRQWGRHAVAFVGERHFDDPYLVERILCRSSDGHFSDGSKGGGRCE
jgi:hypothetical protein